MGLCLSSADRQRSSDAPTARAASPEELCLSVSPPPPVESPRLSTMRPTPLVRGITDNNLPAATRVSGSSVRSPSTTETSNGDLVAAHRPNHFHAAPSGGGGTSPHSPLGSSSSASSPRRVAGSGTALRGNSFRSCVELSPTIPVESPRLRSSTNSRTAIAAVQFSDVALISVQSNPLAATGPLSEHRSGDDSDDDKYVYAFPRDAVVSAFPSMPNNAQQQRTKADDDDASATLSTAAVATTAVMPVLSLRSSNATELGNSLSALGTSGLLVGAACGDAGLGASTSTTHSATLVSSPSADNKWQAVPLLPHGKHKDQLARPLAER